MIEGLLGDQGREVGAHPAVRPALLDDHRPVGLAHRLKDRVEVERAQGAGIDHLGLDRHDLKSIIIYGFKRSFWPGDYLSKRQYVRKVIDHYEAVERRFTDSPSGTYRTLAPKKPLS